VRHVIDAEAAAAAIRGNPAQLQELILNLLDNALRHTPAGGKIAVAVGRDGEDALLSVEDSGPGVPAERLERVFERFYSEREGGLGSGLGLTIARAIAQSHGGSLTASSPAGARFELRLPTV
jgi:signal transduction histidine kinase